MVVEPAANENVLRRVDGCGVRGTDQGLIAGDDSSEMPPGGSAAANRVRPRTAIKRRSNRRWVSRRAIQRKSRSTAVSKEPIQPP
jgi:hypothetical protein